MPVEAIVFDAFGTLLDTASAARRHAERLGAGWEAFGALWRAKQLEYTWIRSLAAQHRDFARITDDALALAAAAHGLRDPALLASLRDAFDHLDVYPDVVPALTQLRDRGIGRAILSNGTPSMLAHQLRAGGIEALLDEVLSVEAVGVYKPRPEVYQLAVDRLGVASDRIGFVSSNPWDVFGAHCFGFQAFRLNRAGAPDEYGLHGQVTELPHLSALLAALG